MITSTIKGVRISGVAGAAPTHKVHNTEYYELFGRETVDKIIDSTGVEGSFHVHERQTAGDLAFAAAENLLSRTDSDLSSIGILIFVGSYPDYFAPATANVIQKRLGLSQDCIVYDMNLACSGFVLGLHTTASLLTTSSTSRALLILGDTTSRVVSPQDKSRLLFGDAGAAVLLEKDERAGEMHFGIKNDGARFKAIIVPAGAFRRPEGSRKMEEWPDKNIRSEHHLFMNGTDVFSFTMSDVPKLIKGFLDHCRMNIDDFDAAVFHQPNAFILKHLAKKLKLSPEKMPLSLGRYGNTSGVSIPVTMCDAFGSDQGREIHLLFSGFGVGLSWAVATAEVNTAVIHPVIHTDDYYAEGLVDHG